MYGGRIVESARVDDLFEKPEMPYTWGLLGSLPRVDIEGRHGSSRSRASRLRCCGRRQAARSTRAAPTRSTAAVRSCRSCGPRRVRPTTISAATSMRETARGSGLEKQAALAASKERCGVSELLVVENLREVLPGHAWAHLPEGDRPGQGGRRRQLHSRGRPDARSRRRVRLRQVDDGAVHRSPA